MISLSGISYFVLIAVVMLYVSMVLIGRRHWTGRDDGGRMWAHYLARAVALLLLAVGVNMFLSHHNALRVDITSQRLNSLSGQHGEVDSRAARQSGRQDDQDRRLRQSASAGRIRRAQAQPALDALRAAGRMSGGKIVVDVHEIENFSEASLARRADLRHRAA